MGLVASDCRLFTLHALLQSSISTSIQRYVSAISRRCIVSRSLRVADVRERIVVDRFVSKATIYQDRFRLQVNIETWQGVMSAERREPHCVVPRVGT